MTTEPNGTTNLVAGLGEVGSAVRTVLQCDGHDPYKGVTATGTYDILHVCIPFNDSFVRAVQELKDTFKPKLVIIHSSVPVGTSRSLDAVHSPIRGVHPNLVLGILTFVKFFGGGRAKEASEIFKAKGVHVFCTDKQENTEALKLWDTTQYGVMILLNKEIKKYCDKNGLDFDMVYTMGNSTYNAGYRELGRREVVRPYLKYMEGKIGGHCVVENAHLLDTMLAKLIIEENGKL